jgi:23S rRNA (cytosine1962-C5)-methyltransferase
MKTVKIHPSKTSSIIRKHPWVFSGALMKGTEAENGTMVRLEDVKNNFLAIGHFQNHGSIAVRILTFEEEKIDQGFWNKKVGSAWAWRKTLLSSNSNTNCFRLIHGEGDGLPGLIVDIYNNAAVIQCHSFGMYQSRNDIAAAIRKELGELITTIYCKSKESLPDKIEEADHFILGEESEAVVSENGNLMHVNWVTGQKTGFFLDQRQNRLLVQSYSKDAKVLDLFCNTGGFSLYALKGGAKHVSSVDVSQKAIDLVALNMKENKVKAKQYEVVCADVMQYLKDSIDTYDVIVVDPPAFAKSIQKKHNAVQGYKRLNVLAFKHVEAGGLVFTFSCSQVIDEELFYNTIVAAAIESGRNFQVVHKLTQGPDHPVNIFHREGSYLKGLVLRMF